MYSMCDVVNCYKKADTIIHMNVNPDIFSGGQLSLYLCEKHLDELKNILKESK